MHRKGDLVLAPSVTQPAKIYRAGAVKVELTIFIVIITMKPIAATILNSSDKEMKLDMFRCPLIACIRDDLARRVWICPMTRLGPIQYLLAHAFGSLQPLQCMCAEWKKLDQRRTHIRDQASVSFTAFITCFLETLACGDHAFPILDGTAYRTE